MTGDFSQKLNVIFEKAKLISSDQGINKTLTNVSVNGEAKAKKKLKHEMMNANLRLLCSIAKKYT